jgi:hypothetical protein
LVRGLDDEAVMAQLTMRQISEQPLTFEAAWDEFPELITDGAFSTATGS